MLTPAGMTALEVAVGQTLCPDSPQRPSARNGSAPAGGAPARALQQALLPALRRAPCVVAFSGGRDSSLVLAVAAVAARREGLPAPVPVTLRFPRAAESEESRWQELVVGHLGLDDWVKIELAEELDFVGPVAGPLLQRHGPLFPPNAHLLAPIAERAPGGSVVSGLGGDELLGLWQRRRLADVAARRAAPSWRDAGRLAGAWAPERVRATVLRRRRHVFERLPWLRPHAQSRLDAVTLTARGRAPIRWDGHVAAVGRDRTLRLSAECLRRIAADHGVVFHVPLLAPAFLAALAAAGGWRGFGGRTATMRALFDGLLPAELLARSDKATFGEVFFADATRRFATTWSGRGLDDSLVDPETLPAVWSGGWDYRSALLLQSAWLHDRRSERA